MNVAFILNIAIVINTPPSVGEFVPDLDKIVMAIWSEITMEFRNRTCPF